MGLKLFVGTEKMCMFHEPAGFWPNIFFKHFFGAFQKVTILYLEGDHWGPLVQSR